MRIATTAITALLLAGCASQPPCDVEAAAQAAVEQGVVRDALVEHFPRCADHPVRLAVAYDRVLADYCKPEQAWQASYTGRGSSAVCEAGGSRLWLEAWRLGAQLAEFERRLESLRSDMTGLEAQGGDPADLRKLRIEAQRFEREIEQIQGIARIRGWL